MKRFFIPVFFTFCLSMVFGETTTSSATDSLIATDSSATTASSTSTASESVNAPPPEVLKEIERRLKDFAQKNGLTIEAGTKGPIAKDKKGNIVPIPPELFSFGQPSPPKEVIEKLISAFLKQHKGEGFTSEKDQEGRTIVKDKEGHIVPLQAFLPHPPGSDVAEKVQKALPEFLKKNKDRGFKIEKDKDGQPHIKDKNGKELTPEEVLGISSSTASLTSDISSDTLTLATATETASGTTDTKNSTTSTSETSDDTAPGTTVTEPPVSNPDDAATK